MATQPQSAAPARLIDVKEWAAMEGEPFYELVEGRLVKRPEVAFWHELLLMRLVRYLLPHVDDHRRGRLVVATAPLRISAITGRKPDIYLIPEDQFVHVGKNMFKGVPPLAVEILSPSTRRVDRGPKRLEYASLGIGQYWIVDFPARKVEVYELRDGAYELAATAEGAEVFRPTLFPGLEIPLDAVWPVEFENRTD